MKTNNIRGKTKKRKSKNTLGTVKINSNKLWGTTTQRTLNKFSVGKEKVSYDFIKSIIMIKKAINLVNLKHNKISKKIGESINQACETLLRKNHREHFPLMIWQCGSGTQINMNVNEVIANLADSISKQKLVSPTNHVNMFQSTNDIMPMAMNLTIIKVSRKKLIPELKFFEKILNQKTKQFKNVVKLGKTHLKDAAPISLSQEYSSYLSQIKQVRQNIKNSLNNLLNIPAGGTCVGTGLNTYKDFDRDVINKLGETTGIKLKLSKNKFKDISSHNEVLEFTASLNQLAVNLLKMSSDINLASSGPVSGFDELIMPVNEIGSSSMPGKFNNSTTEMIASIAIKTISVHQLVTMALTHGNFQLNVFKPLIINEVLNNIRLVSDGLNVFARHTLRHIKPNYKKLKKDIDKSFVKYTKLTPILGYDFLSELYHKTRKNKTLNIESEILKSKLLTKKQLKNLMNNNNLTTPYK